MLYVNLLLDLFNSINTLYLIKYKFVTKKKKPEQKLKQKW